MHAQPDFSETNRNSKSLLSLIKGYRPCRRPLMVFYGRRRRNHENAHANGRSPCETPEQQQDSSPRQAKCPYAKLPKASNGSKLRAQGMQNTSQQKCFPLPLESIKHVLWPAPSLRGWVRNQYTATPNAVEEVMRSFRKPRTAARFVPKACKTQARKKANQKRRVRNPSTWCRNCWQRIRKGQTPLQAELGQAKNDAFATLPHGAETAASKP